MNFDPSQDFTGLYFHLASDGGDPGTLITLSDAPCFRAGTLIETEAGPVAVACLKVSDHVVIASGLLRPISWIGHRDLDIAYAGGRHARRQKPDGKEQTPRDH